MTTGGERQLWQTVALLACIVPVFAGGSGVLAGAAMIRGVPHPAPTDLDSHLRYLSGLLLGIGIAFAWAAVGIRRRGGIFQLLGLIVICGGLARLLSLVEMGLPGIGHRFGLAMELGVVPLLMLWQRRLPG